MGDLSLVLPINTLQNTYSDVNNMELDTTIDDDPSFNLINEIASSLSNQMTTRSPPVVPPKPIFFEHASLLSAGGASESDPAATVQNADPSLNNGTTPISSDVSDVLMTPKTSRSSFKRVSKLNRTNPTISFLDDTAGYDPGLFFESPTTKQSSSTVLPIYELPQPMDVIDSHFSSKNSRKNSSGFDNFNCDEAPSTLKDDSDTVASDDYHSNGKVTRTNSSSSSVSSLFNSNNHNSSIVSDSVSSLSAHINNLNNNIVSSLPAPVRSMSNSSNVSSNSSSSSSSSQQHQQQHQQHTSSNSRQNSSGSLQGAVTSNLLHSHTPSQSCTSLRSVEEDGGSDSVLLMEKRSFRPFKSSEDYLFAMREDLAEWLSTLYELNINADNFFEMLETGEVLCQVCTFLADILAGR